MSSCISLLFVLPARGGGGGAHSIAQEADEMVRLGNSVNIAVDEKNVLKFSTTYADMPNVCNAVKSFKNSKELGYLMRGKDLVVCTVFTTVDMVKKALDNVKGKPPKIAYYIQDYEPLFSPVDNPLHAEAFASYNTFPEALLYAKTDWIRNVVASNHDVNVKKVYPSLDNNIYYPNSTVTFNDPTRISVMVRPSTPRRAPHRTMITMKELSAIWGKNISINVFGCTDDNIVEHQLPRDFEYTNLGILSRTQMGALLRQSDVFMDLSDYQAFGRTGLEAMACGCACILPALGGTDEYAIDKVNSRVVDTRNVESIIDAFSWYQKLCDKERRKLRHAAIEKSLEYSVRRAAVSELVLFEQFLAA